MVPEVLGLSFLSIGMFAMYLGIQINHPIYALLFINLTFPAVATIMNFLALAFLPFRLWVRLSLFLDFFRCQCHQHFMQNSFSRKSLKGKKTVKSSVSFSLLGSASIKAVCKTFVKLTPSVNVTNILQADILYKKCFTKQFYN